MVSVKFDESAVHGQCVWRDASAGDDDAKKCTAIEIAPVIGNLWSRQTWQKHERQCEPRQVLWRASADLQKTVSKR
jgi:hypothetical protein